MCPPPRSLALEANGCFMVQARKANRIQGCGATIVPDSELPSDSDRTTAQRALTRNSPYKAFPSRVYWIETSR
ncbi:MAG: hypothetical protein ACI9HH_005492 [Pseudomonadota bacterium]|jgi:hypothetical protein